MDISYTSQGFSGGSDYKESACNAGDLGLIPVLGRSPGGGCGNPPQYSCLENPHGQRSLAGYKKSDTTEQLTHTNTHTHLYFSLLSYFPNKRVSGEESLDLVALVHAIQVAPKMEIIRIQVMILFYKYIILFMLPTLRHI